VGINAAEACTCGPRGHAKRSCTGNENFFGRARSIELALADVYCVFAAHHVMRKKWLCDNEAGGGKTSCGKHLLTFVTIKLM